MDRRMAVDDTAEDEEDLDDIYDEAEYWREYTISEKQKLENNAPADADCESAVPVRDTDEEEEAFAPLFESAELQGDVKELFDACRDNDLGSVRHLIQSRWLLGRGIDANAHFQGKTPLMLACAMTHVEIATYLVGAGANVNFPDLDGRTALHSARSAKMVALLLSNGADDKEAWKLRLQFAVIRGDVDMARELLNLQEKTDKRLTIDTPIGNHGDTKVCLAVDRVLILACAANQMEMVKFLLHDARANANFTDLDGRTALQFAKSGEVAALLLSNGANNLEVWKLRLQSAIFCGDIDITRGLLDFEGNAGNHFSVDTRFGNQGNTALILACTLRQLKMVKFLLLEAGANVNFTDSRGRPPLHATRDREIVDLLMACGADINAADGDGTTLLHLALGDKDYNFMRRVLNAGARVDIADIWGSQVLHEAIVNFIDQRQSSFVSSVRVIRDLVEHGAKWDHRCDIIVDDEGQSTGPSSQLLRRRLGPALRFAVLLWADEHSLDMPLTPIPREELERGLEATKTYVRERQASKSVVFRRTICLVGPSTAGKTSLINSVVNQAVWLASTDVRTIGVDRVKFEFDDGVRAALPRSHAITFSDFAGQDAYQPMHSLFFTRRTLFLVCVDLEAYSIALLKCEMLTPNDRQLQHLMNEYVDRHVLQWIRLIFARQPDAEFVFICTKEDAISSGPGVDKAEVVNHMRTMLGRVMMIVQHMRRDYERSQNESGSKVGTGVTHLWEPSLAKCIAPEVKVIMTSSTTTSSVMRARQEVIKLIVRTSSSSYEMPEKYTIVLHALTMRKLAAAIKSRVLRIEDIFVDVTELIKKLQRSVRDLDDETARAILRSIRDRGDILWYEDMEDEKLKQTVILEPRLLIAFLREVTNHKHPKGVLSHKLLAQLPCWMDIHNDTKAMLAMKRLLQTFHLVHPTSGEMAFDSDLIVPAYWKTNRHAVWIFGGDDLRLSPRGSKDEVVSRRILWEFRFAHYIPHILFDNFIVATYSPTIPLDVGPDYILYRNADRAACRIVMSRERKTQLRSLRLEAVLADAPDIASQASALWVVFKRLCTALAAVLKEHKGLVVTSCAHTNEDGYHPNLRSLFKSRDTMVEEDQLGIVWMPPGAIAYECLQLLVGSY